MELARLAQAADHDVLVRLLGAALTDVRTQRGGAVLAGDATAEELMKRWTSESSATVLWAGEFDQAVVGLAAASTFKRDGANEQSGRIECCYVEPGARGVGVGAALMEAMVAWCRDHGCLDMDALALPGDRSSKQRLEAAGFTARLLTLSRRLD